jgi:hypothetical protein
LKVHPIGHELYREAATVRSGSPGKRFSSVSMIECRVLGFRKRGGGAKHSPEFSRFDLETTREVDFLCG